MRCSTLFSLFLLGTFVCLVFSFGLLLSLSVVAGLLGQVACDCVCGYWCFLVSRVFRWVGGGGVWTVFLGVLSVSVAPLRLLWVGGFSLG